MKQKLILFLVLLTAILGYLFLTHNPTVPGLQTKIVTQLAKLTDTFFLPYYFKSHQLPVYELNLSPNNYITLNKNMPDPTKTRLLTDEYKQYLPAKLKYDQLEYDVDVSYWGVDFDHWHNPKKSWRIKFNPDKPFIGQTTINLIIPEDRGMYLEELSNYRANKLGLIVSNSQFVVLKVNGQTQGVYWQVEHWTPAFLERSGLPVGNLYGEDDEALLKTETKPLFSSIKYWTKYTQDEIYSEDNYAEMAILLDLINNVSDEEFFQKLPQILDMDNFLIWQAHSVLMGSTHQGSTRNLRPYWHPALGKFYIFPWDVLGDYGWPVDYHPLVARVLKNPDWLEKRNQILQDYLSNPQNLADDLKYYDQLVDQTKTAVFQDYRKFFSNFGYLRQLKQTRQQLIDQFELIKTSLKNQTIPDEVSGFDFPNQNKLDVLDASKTVIKTEFQDFEKNFTQASQLTYGPGDHYINQTIIIPSGNKLRLLPGARLLFAKDTSLLSYSQVEASMAVLTAQNPAEPWGVFAVVGPSASHSQFNQVTVEYGNQAVINGTYFTGALALHGAENTLIKNSVFRYNHGDDGLNIKYDPQVRIINNQFIENKRDGLDLDFSQGEVIGNILLNNGNDGLDFGSASPLVKDNLVKTAGDKCISLGETSSPRIENNTFKDCNMAIAVKDSSQPEIVNNIIQDNHIGLASYQKKFIFPRLPFIFTDNQLLGNEIDFEEEDSSLRHTDL